MAAATSSSAGPARAGSEPAGSAGLAPKSAPSTRAVAAVSRTGPNVMRLQAELDEAGTLDFRWRYIGKAAAELLPCTAWRLLGRCMSEGQAGAFDHPVLVERYRLILEQRTPRSFEQVHLVQGQQHLVVHHVVRVGGGVAVTLIDLSAARLARPSWRSGRARAFMTQFGH